MHNLNGFLKIFCKFLHKEFLKLWAKYTLWLGKFSEILPIISFSWILAPYHMMLPMDISYYFKYYLLLHLNCHVFGVFVVVVLVFVCLFVLLFLEYHSPGSIGSPLYMTYNEILFSKSLPFRGEIISSVLDKTYLWHHCYILKLQREADSLINEFQV